MNNPSSSPSPAAQERLSPKPKSPQILLTPPNPPLKTFAFFSDEEPQNKSREVHALLDLPPTLPISNPERVVADTIVLAPGDKDPTRNVCIKCGIYLCCPERFPLENHPDRSCYIVKEKEDDSPPRDFKVPLKEGTFVEGQKNEKFHCSGSRNLNLDPGYEYFRSNLAYIREPRKPGKSSFTRGRMSNRFHLFENSKVLNDFLNDVQSRDKTEPLTEEERKINGRFSLCKRCDTARNRNTPAKRFENVSSQYMNKTTRPFKRSNTEDHPERPKERRLDSSFSSLTPPPEQGWPYQPITSKQTTFKTEDDAHQKENSPDQWSLQSASMDSPLNQLANIASSRCRSESPHSNKERHDDLENKLAPLLVDSNNERRRSEGSQELPSLSRALWVLRVYNLPGQSGNVRPLNLPGKEIIMTLKVSDREGTVGELVDKLFDKIKLRHPTFPKRKLKIGLQHHWFTKHDEKVDDALLPQLEDSDQLPHDIKLFIGELI